MTGFEPVKCSWPSIRFSNMLSSAKESAARNVKGFSLKARYCNRGVAAKASAGDKMNQAI